MRKSALCLSIAAVIAVVSGAAGLIFAETPTGPKVRQAAVAGMFYPADAATLKRTVSESLSAAQVERFDQPIRAIMAPHAGYVYCGRTLAAAYKQIEAAAFPYDTAVLVGPSHGFPTKAAALSSADAWQTPLGSVRVDAELSRRFADHNPRIEFDDRAHAREHCLEVQLPYLIVASGGKPFSIVPIVTSSADPVDHEILARALVRLARTPRTLIVLSTDLSHYPTADAATKVDKAILGAVTSLDPAVLESTDRRLMKEGHAGLSVTMCGLNAVVCLQRAAKGLGITAAKEIDYTHSGMSGGDSRRVVGYGAVVFTGAGISGAVTDGGPQTLSFSQQSKNELTGMVRAAVQAAVEGKWVAFDATDNPELNVRAGCFVTLKNKGELRGCIGTFSSDAPLLRTVREIAIQSATMDERFRANPITPREVPELQVEISVLSPMRRVVDALKEIELGRDGIVITDNGRSGTFLPQVATETGWTLEEFLGHCARDKAGLDWNGWKSPTAGIFAYTCTIIQEEE